MDFNVCYNANANLHVNLLTEFISSNDLFNLLLINSHEVNYTYESKQNGVRSTIDNFLVSENIADYVILYKLLHDWDNFSDHCAIVLCMNVPIIYDQMPQDKETKTMY